MSTLFCKAFNIFPSLRIFSCIHVHSLLSENFITLYHILMSACSKKNLITFTYPCPKFQILQYLMSGTTIMSYRKNKFFPFQMPQTSKEAACCGGKSTVFVRKIPPVINYASLLNGIITNCFIESSRN